MIETKEKVIDELNVKVVQFGARRGLKLKMKLIKTFGAPLLKMIDGMGVKTTEIKEVMNSDINLGAMGEGLNLLFTKIDEDVAEKIIDEILAGTFIDDKEVKVVFDQVFSGNFLTMYKVIGFALEVNFGSFFGKSGIGTLTKK